MKIGSPYFLSEMIMYFVQVTFLPTNLKKKLNSQKPRLYEFQRGPQETPLRNIKNKTA